MYCNKCGKFLAGSENFCSNCGEKVIKETEVAKEVVEVKEKVEKESIKIISPVDDFTWDLKEFPTNKPKKTEDAQFSWNSGDMFLHKEIVRENAMRGTVTDNSKVQEQISNSFCFRGNSIESERERKAKEEAEQKAIEEKKKRKNTASNLEVPSVFKYRLDKMEEKEGYNIEDDMPDFLREELDRNTVTRNTKPYEANQFENEFVVEIEQPSAGGITVEIGEEEKTPSLSSMLEKIEEDNKEESSPLMCEEAEGKNELSVDKTEYDEKSEADAEETKSSLMEEIAEEVQAALDISDENLAEENKKIDKFYTFNKKKEEFQKLLDREYERMEGKVDKGGLEDDISGFMDVSTGKDVEATSQIEEMIKARAMFFEDPIAREYVDSLENEEKEAIEAREKAINEYDVDESLIDDETETLDEDVEETIAEAIGDENKAEEGEEIEETEEVTEEEVATEVVFEPANEESLAEVLFEKEEQKKEDEESVDEAEEMVEISHTDFLGEEEPEQTESEEEKTDLAEENTITEAAVDSTGIATVIIDPAQEKKNMTEKLAEEFFDDDEEEEKSSGRALVYVLIVLIFLVAGLLCTRVFMPDTVISKYIDTFAQKVVTMIEGVIPGETESEDQRDTLIEDKTALIELQKDKNYNNSIETIEYDEDANYSSKKEYEISDLTGAKDIQTNFWYEEKDKNFYYDEELVGLIIAFESKREAYVNEGEKKVFQHVEKDSPIEAVLEKEQKADTKIDFKKLGIGDIKVAGDSYYVWVKESIDDDVNEMVYRIKEIDRTLIVVDVCEG